MEALTRRELQVADLIHQGLIEKEIAQILFLSPGTVHSHKKSIFQKLHARNIADITRIFLLDLKKPEAIMMMFIALSLQVTCMVLDRNDQRKPVRTRISASIGKVSKQFTRSFKWNPQD